MSTPAHLGGSPMTGSKPMPLMPNTKMNAIAPITIAQAIQLAMAKKQIAQENNESAKFFLFSE